MKDKAAQLLERVLAPSGEKAQAAAKRHAPYFLEQMGTRLAGKSREQVSDLLGSEADRVMAVRNPMQAQKGGELVDATPILQELEARAQKVRAPKLGTIQDPNAARSINSESRLLRQHIQDNQRNLVQEMVQSGQITPDDAVKFEEEIVRRGGEPGLLPGDEMLPFLDVENFKNVRGSAVYNKGVPISVREASKQGAMKLASDASRRVVDESDPAYAALNREFHGLQEGSTMAGSAALAERTQKPSFAGEVLSLSGLAKMALGGAAGFGASGGNPIAAAAGASAPFVILRAINSPRWLTTSAVVRYQASKLIEAGELDKAAELITRALSTPDLSSAGLATAEGVARAKRDSQPRKRP